MQKKYLLIFVLVLLLAVAGTAASFNLIAQSGTTQAQEPQEKAAGAPPEKPALQAIPATEITLQAERVKARLNQIRSVVDSVPDVSRIASELPELIKNLERARGELEAVVLEDLSINQLNELQDEWLRYKILGDNSQRSLVNRSQSLDNKRAELRQFRETWELTRVVAAEEGYADALREQIGSTLAEIETGGEALRNRLNDVFALQSQVSDQTMAITEVLNQIETVREKSRLTLFAQDRAPLWQIIFSPSEDLPVWEQIGNMVRDRAHTLRNFYIDYRQHLLFHLFLFIGMAVILIVVRRRLSGSQEEAFRPSAYLLSRPISVSVLIGLILSILIYPRIPVAIEELIALLGLIPLLRLLPGLVDPALRKPLYGLGIVYFLGQLNSLLADRSLAQRLVLLVALTLAIGGLIWLLKRDGPLSQLKPGRWVTAAALFLRLCLLLFAGAWLANVLGNVALAETLAAGTFWSLYTLALILTSVLVLEDLTLTFLKSRAGESLRMIRLHTVFWERGIRRALYLAAFAWWAHVTLLYFTLLEPVRAAALRILRGHLAVGALDVSLGDILAFILTLWISFPA
jgi:hypothetical protein